MESYNNMISVIQEPISLLRPCNLSIHWFIHMLTTTFYKAIFIKNFVM